MNAAEVSNAQTAAWGFALFLAASVVAALAALLVAAFVLGYIQVEVH